MSNICIDKNKKIKKISKQSSFNAKVTRVTSGKGS
ncbi:hypothetical protein MAMMFC1_03065 [Methylomusa anaerophila]|uniref:Uncharacterized protein n=1 Tax=Methylomusa anaerophila TaxID=1930071 RepID=A0A348AMS4_9FIRM|nr:hypothetical protein MAMMFC1_03065 [Methylomusa anaerophila]